MNQLATTHTVTTQITADLHPRLAAYVLNSKAPNTVRAYKAGWAAFTVWCRGRRLDALPACPTTVALFVADQADQFRVSTLQLRLAAIGQAHEAAGCSNPTKTVEVRTTMKGIRRHHGVRPTKKQALLVGDVIAICARLDDDLRGHRDRALLLLGFAGGFRRSELVAVNVADIAFTHDGMVVKIDRSKTDQEGAGRSVGIGHGTDDKTCPVTAVRRWMGSSGIETGPLFRAIDRHGHLRDGRLSKKSVARIIKRLGQQVGLDPKVLGAHSLRSGLATSAAAAGIAERDIARQTGHRSLLVLRGYIHDGTMFDNDVVRRLGL